MYSISRSRADARTIAALQAGFRRRFLSLTRSRAPLGPDNEGGFRVCDARRNVVAGHSYDLTIRDARQHLRDYPTRAV